MNKILVTGAAGLIGSALISKLIKQNFAVIPCDIRFIGNPLSFSSEEIKPLIEESVGIIHLAAISRVIHGEIYKDLCNKVNIDETKKLLELCRNAPNKPWFIYGSSREVYGQPLRLPVVETDPLQPINNYAVGKVIVESMVEALQGDNINIAILRFSNVFGGLADHYDRVVPAFCLHALNNRSLRLDGSECVFDFTYIEDVVDGIVLAVNYLQQERTSLPPIHFTSNNPYNLAELAQMVLRVTGSKSEIVSCLPRSFDVSNFYGSFERARSLLGWAPKYSLELGLTSFISKLRDCSIRKPSSNLEMVIYENIKSYSWLPALL